MRGGGRTPAHRRGLGPLRPGDGGPAAAAGGREAAPPPGEGLALDPPRTRRRPHRHPRRGRSPGPGRRERHRPPPRHGRRGRLPRVRPRGRGPPPPGPHVPGAHPGPGGLGGPGRGGQPALLDGRPRHHGDLRPGDGRRNPVGPGPVVLRLRRSHQPGRLLPPPTRHHRRGPGRVQTRPPPRTLRTRAVWWTVTEDQLDAARINPEILGGALHAAEHASIGMLPSSPPATAGTSAASPSPCTPTPCSPRSSSTTATRAARASRNAPSTRPPPGSPPPARPSPPANATPAARRASSPQVRQRQRAVAQAGAVRLLAELLRGGAGGGGAGAGRCVRSAWGEGGRSLTRAAARRGCDAARHR